jgi:uncharacterized protein (DUF433 family)
MERFPGEELKQVPAALGEAFMMLRLSPEHLELALDTMFEFDLYEATPGLARLLRVDPVPQALATAATFAKHPGASDDLQGLVLRLSAQPLADAHVRQLVQLSLTPDAQAGSRPHEIAHIRRWPGSYTEAQAAAPIVAVAPSAGPYEETLRFLLDLHRAGAVVRRLPDRSPEEPVDERWLARWIPVIAADDQEVAWWTSLPHGRVLKTHGRLTPAVRRDIVRALRRTLPVHLRLRSAHGTSTPASPITSPLTNTDAFFSGAFQSHEVAYLGGLTVQQVWRTGGRPELKPIRRASHPYWSFPVLIALRVWTYLNARLDRRLSIDIAVEFVNGARSERAVPVAVTHTGQVLFHLKDDLYEGPGGQLTPELFLLGDQVLERFSIGNRHAPRLEEPTDHTSVHPEVQGGSPVVRGTRIPVEAVEDLVRECWGAGLSGPQVYAYVQERYPELGDPQVIDDAADLARRMQRTS